MGAEAHGGWQAFGEKRSKAAEWGVEWVKEGLAGRGRTLVLILRVQARR